MAKHTKGALRAKKSSQNVARTEKPNKSAPRGQKTLIRFSGWNLFMRELSGPVWRRLAGKDRFRYASALWRSLSRAERGEYDARAVAIREDAQRLRENPAGDQWILAEDNGSAVAAEARTVADDPGLEVPRAESMWRAHSDHSSTPPSAYSAADTTSYDAGVPLPGSQDYTTRWALSGADASSVDFCAGDSSGGAAQALAILPANAQQEEFVAAEEWTAFINRLLVADENSAHAPSPISFVHETLGRCSPASQAVIELLAGTLRHGGGESFYPTPSPSVGSPTEMAGDTFCEVGSPGLSAADAPSRMEYYEDPPLTPPALVPRSHERWLQSTEPGSSGGDSTAPVAPFGAMILETASLASERCGATSTA